MLHEIKIAPGINESAALIQVCFDMSMHSRHVRALKNAPDRFQSEKLPIKLNISVARNFYVDVAATPM